MRLAEHIVDEIQDVGGLLGARLKKKAPALLYAAAALVLVVSCAYLVDATYNPFLYFRF